MKANNIIFDLDGTLVDSLPGIEASTRYALAQEMAAPARALPSMRDVIGPPIAKMFAQLWPELSEGELNKLLASFRRHYDGEGCLLSELYAGVYNTLSRLQAEKVSMFVLTNKPARASQCILRHLGVRDFFDEVVSPDAREPAFLTKPEGGRYLQEKHALEPSSTFLLGDGADDLAAAQSCGFTFVAAAYGYGSLSGQHHQDRPTVKSFPNILDIVL